MLEWQNLVDCLNRLSGSSPSSPGDAEEFNRQASALACVFEAVDASTRLAISAAVARRAQGRLLDYAWHRAEDAVRESDSEAIAHGLLALVIEGGTYDVRDDICVMALLWHSAERLGIDPAAPFSRAVAVAPSGRLRDALSEYPLRTPHERRLWNMGVRESTGGGRFRYEFVPTEEYLPRWWQFEEIRARFRARSRSILIVGAVAGAWIVASLICFYILGWHE